MTAALNRRDSPDPFPCGGWWWRVRGVTTAIQRNFPNGVAAPIVPWLIALLCALPVLATPILPIIDIYAHALRYDILANVASDPDLARNFSTNWKLLPNLGLDLIATPVFRSLPPLAASRFVVILIVLAPFVGTLILARCVQGGLTYVAVALGGVLAHNSVLAWGFGNFLLGLGIALAGLGFWIADRDRPRRQFMTAVGLGVVIFVAHGLLFAIWGLLLLAVELAAVLESERRSRLAFVRRAGRLALVAVLPVLAFLATDTVRGGAQITTVFGNVAGYIADGNLTGRLVAEVWKRLDSLLRVADSAWPTADRAFGILLWGGLLLGWRRGLFGLDRRLRIAVAGIAALVVLMPPNLMGVGHLDERVPLVLLALLTAGLVPTATAARHPLVLVALVSLLPLHLVMVTSGWLRERDADLRFLAATEALASPGLANIVYAPEATGRDAYRWCQPLAFVMGMTRGTGVPTFADPTQQPLALRGPLAEALARAASVSPQGTGTGDRVAHLLGAGFDRVILCRVPGFVAPEVEGAGVASAERYWTLYVGDPG